MEQQREGALRGNKAPGQFCATNGGKVAHSEHHREGESQQLQTNAVSWRWFRAGDALHSCGSGKLSAAAITIYRTRYRDPEGQRGVSEWAETGVAAEFHRAEIEQRFAAKKLDIAIDRFELNPGKSDILRFPNEHAHD